MGWNGASFPKKGLNQDYSTEGICDADASTEIDIMAESTPNSLLPTSNWPPQDQSIERAPSLSQGSTPVHRSSPSNLCDDLVAHRPPFFVRSRSEALGIPRSIAQLAEAHKICSPIGDAEDDVGIYVASSANKFGSIAEAMRHALPGETIHLGRGLYEESETIVFDKPGVTLQSACQTPGGVLGGAVCIGMVGEHMRGIVCSATGICIKGIRFSMHFQNGSPSVSPSAVASCIEVESGNVSLIDCAFSNDAGYGLVVSGNATPTIKTCTFSKCSHAGAVFKGTSRATFSRNIVRQNAGFGLVINEMAGGDFCDNNIFENRRCAVLCGGSCVPVLEMNNVAGGLQGGVWIQDDSKCTLRRNRIYNNRKAAVQVSARSDPFVFGNKLIEGKGGGLVVHEDAKGTYIKNSMSNNEQAGIGVMDRAVPLIMENTVMGNRSGGIVMAGECTPILSSNTITHNSFAGVGVKGKARPLLEAESIRDNQGYGVLMQDSANAVFQHCSVEDNKKSGVCCTGSSQIRLSGCCIGGEKAGSMQKVGLTLYDDSQIVMQDTTLLGHSGGNIVMRDRSQGLLISNTISNADGAGIVMQCTSNLGLFGSIVRDCKVSNTVVLDTARVVARGNTFCNSRGTGIFVMDQAEATVEHNSILGNSECGLRCAGDAYMEASFNSIGNGDNWGVLLEERCNVVLHSNVIYGNSAAALHAQDKAECEVRCNAFIKGAVQCPTVEASGEITGVFADNVVQGWGECHTDEGLQVQVQGVRDCVQEDADQVLQESLEMLSEAQSAVTKRVVVINPCSGMCVGVPCGMSWQEVGGGFVMRRTNADADLDVSQAESAPSDSQLPL